MDNINEFVILLQPENTQMPDSWMNEFVQH